MDYSSYKQIEFRRKFFKFFGVDIYITDPSTNNMIGFINQKTIMVKPDVYVYTGKDKQRPILNVKKETFMSVNDSYAITDSESNKSLGAMKFNDLRALFTRWHVDILDANGSPFGYVQETSSFLALLRRFIGLFSDIAELVLAFVPQTFDIYYAPNGQNPQLVGRITHRKNPIIVKMGLDLSQGQVSIDPKINLAVCTLLCLRDINKNA